MSMSEEDIKHHLHTQSAGVFWDKIFKGAAFSFAAIVLFVMLAIMLMLFKEAWPTFAHFGFHFFYTSEWDAVNDQYGALVPIVGTLVTSLIALVIVGGCAFNHLRYVGSFLLRPLVLEFHSTVHDGYAGRCALHRPVLPGSTHRRQYFHRGFCPRDHDRALHRVDHA